MPQYNLQLPNQFTTKLIVLSKTNAKSCLLMLVLMVELPCQSDHKPRPQFAYIPSVCKALYDLRGLTSDSSLQEVYCEDLNDCVSRIKPGADFNKALADMLDCVKKSAETTIGKVSTNKTITATKTPMIAPWNMQ